MNRDAFFATIRPKLGPFRQSQVDGFVKVLDEGERRAVSLYHEAYILATAWWETARAMQPVREGGGEAYLRGKAYYPWVGEGLVQVTWEENHRKFGATAPGQLMTWPIALRALYDGMMLGMFTGKKLADYIKPGNVDYTNARRVVNGTDKAKEIASIALLFEKALRDAAWGAAMSAPPPPDAADFKEELAEERLKPRPEPKTAPPSYWDGPSPLARVWAWLKGLLS